VKRTIHDEAGSRANQVPCLTGKSVQSGCYVYLEDFQVFGEKEQVMLCAANLGIVHGEQGERGSHDCTNNKIVHISVVTDCYY
jgi:hypothetical protein